MVIFAKKFVEHRTPWYMADAENKNTIENHKSVRPVVVVFTSFK